MSSGTVLSNQVSSAASVWASPTCMGSTETAVTAKKPRVSVAAAVRRYVGKRLGRTFVVKHEFFRKWLTIWWGCSVRKSISSRLHVLEKQPHCQQRRTGSAGPEPSLASSFPSIPGGTAVPDKLRHVLRQQPPYVLCVLIVIFIREGLAHVVVTVAVAVAITVAVAVAAGGVAFPKEK